MKSDSEIVMGSVTLEPLSNKKPGFSKLRERLTTKLNNKKPLFDESAKGSEYFGCPPCKYCGGQIRPTDMKNNGLDDFGNLYENYHCPKCGRWFTVEYDGPDDFCNASYSED